MKIELLGGCTKEELESRIKRVASAGKLSRFKGNVFDVLDSCDNYENNLKLIKRIIKMGHKSIIEHDYLVFAIVDVSPIVEQTIIGNRLTSFTIKSRREVDFRNVGYYIPEFRNKNLEIHKKNNELQEKYKKHMKYLFNEYANLVDNGINIEDARFILPYSYHSNIIMGLDARELEKLVVSLLYGELSKIAELKELGIMLYEIIEQHVPYLIDSIKEDETNSDNPFEYLESLVGRPEIKICDKAKLINYPENADDLVLESSIMYHYQCEPEAAKEILNKAQEKDADAREKMMDIILNKKENRELEHVNFRFQIPISLSILTHLTRHRMHSLLVPELVKMWDLNNYIIPNSIKVKYEDKYNEIFKENVKVYNEFLNEDIAEEDLIYFYLGGHMCNVITNMSGRTLQWISKLRCCNKAQWQIRNIVNDMVKEVKKVAPLMGKGLGPTCITHKICNEGKESCGLIDNILKADNK